MNETVLQALSLAGFVYVQDFLGGTTANGPETGLAETSGGLREADFWPMTTGLSDPISDGMQP